MRHTHPVLRQTRWPVRWPMLYGNNEFVANGTVLEITSTGYRVAGPMPVYPGMRLSVSVWPPEKPEGFQVEDATVLWVKGYEFVLELHDRNPFDRKWLTRFQDRVLGWRVAQLAA
jgi:hypothetical protein